MSQSQAHLKIDLERRHGNQSTHLQPVHVPSARLFGRWSL